ncbi:NAD(P)/FAD-dependent oxidoreductase [Nodosilinea sp. PGN35]|uniref:NAD(P)/FAD-dependent oxidoreductase n=1 Tax=Nodosilinea sp. PGN35 TaxID=3020489 RepID=UPI0023B3166D|nr:FAD-dependent oxidoreductase [Nodosilinea sp. TSF1-S3]MDF0368194.1 FAD-dependent oxidoreductase [Nodosilinea sp. TSF1-S3]
MEDVVVIGAGLSGLTAAQRLHREGYRVVVIDKSRGLGGRLATRRLGSIAIDHGCRYLQPFADPVASPLPALLAAEVLRPWRPESFELSSDNALTAVPPQVLYGAPQGMSAVAKTLAVDLTVQRHWLATALQPLPRGWRIEGQFLGEAQPTPPETFEARAVIVAIPAPQAIALIGTAAQHHPELRELCHQLQDVTFEAVITVMAGYGNQAARLPNQQGTEGWMVASDTHPTLRWLALDSSKRTTPQDSVVVLHSSAAFAAEVLEQSDLEPAGKTLLTAAASLGDWLSSPQWMQVHRWRYGFVRRALGRDILSHAAIPTLVGCGDWCQGGNAEGAIAAGNRAAVATARALG